MKRRVLRKTPWTTKDMMIHIIGKLKENNLLPEHIDYYSYAGVTRKEIELTSEEFNILTIPAYGGSEGIYLDVYYVDDFEKPLHEYKNILTVKTLETSDSAMYDMYKLAADIYLEYQKWIIKESINLDRSMGEYYALDYGNHIRYCKKSDYDRDKYKGEYNLIDLDTYEYVEEVAV